MRTSSFKVDTDKDMFVCGRFWLPSDIHRSISHALHRRFWLPSDIHRSISHALHRKYLNIVNIRDSFNLRQFSHLKRTSSL